MKRLLPVLAAAMVTLSVVLGSWQGYRYQRLLDEIDDLEATQRQSLDENKRTIASIAVFRSPARLQQLAEQELELARSPDSIFLDLRREPDSAPIAPRQGTGP